MDTKSTYACFGGTMGFHSHASAATGTEMRFGVFLPPQAQRGPCPALYYLAGLTCTEETFAIKGGAQRYAAEHGLVLVMPDTSPRGLNLPGDAESWDFGVGAGFYLDATSEPWAGHYRMAQYVTRELPALMEAEFPVRPDRRGVFGHSMGGQALEEAAQASGQELTLRRQPGDHSYWFIQSFMGDHIAHHARLLG